MASKMLETIPRLENVAAMVADQNAPLADADAFADLTRLDVRTAGRILLRSAIEFDRQVVNRHTATQAAEIMRTSGGHFPQAVIDVMRSLLIAGHEHVLRSVKLVDLAPGMVLDEALFTRKGVCLVPAGHEVTPILIQRLRGIDDGIEVREPIRVQVPT
jgi:hypothetical protein